MNCQKYADEFWSLEFQFILQFLVYLQLPIIRISLLIYNENIKIFNNFIYIKKRKANEVEG